jgi:hypothetical protein
MKNTPIIFAFALATAILFAGGSQACTGSPSMAVEDACHRATTGINETYSQCMNILQAAPREAEVTVYAVVAAGKWAFTEYAALRTEGGEDPKNQSLPAELKDAYNGCLSDYGATKAALGAALRKMDTCDLKTCSGDFDAALSGLEKCRVRLEDLQNVGATGLLYESVLADKGRTTLAYSLTRLAAN